MAYFMETKPKPKIAGRYVASPFDRSRAEVVNSTKRVEFDDSPTSRNRDGINRDAADCFRQNKYGR